jgi:hypothetical protein
VSRNVGLPNLFHSFISFEAWRKLLGLLADFVGEGRETIFQ